MALPPTIPTSFVPHPSSSAARSFKADYTGAFAFLSYGLLVIAILIGIGVFAYGRILASSQASSDQALAKAQAAIDPATVEGFVRLRDRLSWGETLLNSHVAVSGFFGTLSKLIPTNVRFTGLTLTRDETGAVKVEGSGTAKSFNALAAASDAFAEDGRIRDAIFANIVVNPDRSVSFAFTATLDSKIVKFTGASAPSAALPATGTSTATTTP